MSIISLLRTFTLYTVVRKKGTRTTSIHLASPLNFGSPSIITKRHIMDNHDSVCLSFPGVRVFNVAGSFYGEDNGTIMNCCGRSMKFVSPTSMQIFVAIDLRLPTSIDFLISVVKLSMVCRSESMARNNGFFTSQDANLRPLIRDLIQHVEDLHRSLNHLLLALHSHSIAVHLRLAEMKRRLAVSEEELTSSIQKVQSYISNLQNSMRNTDPLEVETRNSPEPMDISDVQGQDKDILDSAQSPLKNSGA